MANEPNSLHSRIREILLADWDPSNASRSEAAGGEYDGYLAPLSELIRSGGGEESIVDYLYDREREIMCFPGLGKHHLRRAARRLLSLQMR